MGLRVGPLFYHAALPSLLKELVCAASDVGVLHHFSWIVGLCTRQAPFGVRDGSAGLSLLMAPENTFLTLPSCVAAVKRRWSDRRLRYVEVGAPHSFDRPRHVHHQGRAKHTDEPRLERPRGEHHPRF